METNTSKVFCVCMAIFLLIVGINTCYNKSNNFENFNFAARQKSLFVTEADNTDTMNKDGYRSETFTMKTESLLSYMPIVCKINSSKRWSMDLMTICIIDLSFILKDQLYFFKRDIDSTRFLPYFLLQLQIVHKSDGKYR